ncbi:MAG: nuclear transport factor 2 family protein [Candidatus Aenigmatarchaeota archaeon]|nr:nuclear transport factor 2 family protein [Nanoarchaeota archaeon]
MEVRKNVDNLVSMVLNGKMMEAFEEYYADNVVMQENEQPARKGKVESRKFEQMFVESVKQVHGAEAKNVAVVGDTAFIEWFMDITFKDGTRKKMTEVAVQKWKNGKVVHEKFYYDSGAS